jgi:Peroxidase
MAPLSLSNS